MGNHQADESDRARDRDHGRRGQGRTRIRQPLGSRHVHSPAPGDVGGAFLVACDAAARLVLAPAELPVGVITAVIGGPFLVWLLRSQAY